MTFHTKLERGPSAGIARAVEAAPRAVVYCGCGEAGDLGVGAVAPLQALAESRRRNVRARRSTRARVGRPSRARVPRGERRADLLRGLPRVDVAGPPSVPPHA